MAACRQCGAPVKIGHPVPTEEDPNPATIVLDVHEASHGAGRYAIWDDQLCRPVSASAMVLAYPVHQCRPPMPR